MSERHRVGQNIGTMKAEKSIPAQVLEFIHTQGLTVGSHLPAQAIADQLKVSRSPVNEALNLLHEKGVLTRESNRGYFVAKSMDELEATLTQDFGLDQTNVVNQIYFRIADDLLKGLLPEEFSETMLKTRYVLTVAQLQAVLNRISHEGWAHKKPGYGWVFSSMLTTPDSLLQSYRLRLAIEPAALLEPGFRLDPQVLARCRAAEIHLLDGGIKTDTADQLHERGVRFHESLVEASGNPFFIDTIRRVNRVRRLLSYRSMQDRKRYKEHCHQHLQVLDLLEQGRNAEASEALRSHLSSTLKNLKKISGILKS
jgi:DNA-binding GntR family transcriptional regulator